MKSAVSLEALPHETYTLLRGPHAMHSAKSPLEIYATQRLLCSRSLLKGLLTMDCSIRGFPVLHQLLELAQSHIH